MGQLKIDSTGQTMSASEDPDTGAVLLTLDQVTDPIALKPDEARMLAMVLLGEVEEPLPGAATSIGVKAIGVERIRQINREGYSLARDREDHGDATLADAAVAYVVANRVLAMRGDVEGEELATAAGWPYEPEEFKPSSYARDLEKAGALIAAEYDRVTAR